MTDDAKGADRVSAPFRVGPTRREAYIRKRRRKAILVAALSTVLIAAVLVVAIPRSPGWDRVRTSFFDGELFRESFPELLGYLWVDVKLFLWCAPCIVVWGLVIAMCRNTRNPVLFPLRVFGAVYTDVFRGVPIILTIYLVGFGIPGLGLAGEFDLWVVHGRWNSPYIWGSVALILAYSAYVAEVFRSGIESIHESQRAAARSLGLSQTRTMRHVVLPQAGRRVIPPLMNDFLSLQKDVALISILGPIEVFRRAQSIKDLTANYTPIVAAAVIFLMLTIPLTRLVDWYVNRTRRRTGGTVTA
ncbi:MAG: putative amino acid ABC transporter permease protein [Acidimicrobiaceae bacterium]|nr:MAG: putative amino acid ABC transporter permease protein [Acidimicrobiaceae bacterium]